MDDDFIKKRLERDLADLKRMCDDHFSKRKEDDAVVTDLEKRISDRQTTRGAQKQARIDAEKQAKEEQEVANAAKKDQEAEKKADILSAMSQGYDKEAARKRRGEKRRLKRRSNAIKAANA